jgi:hypothetical protein
MAAVINAITKTKIVIAILCLRRNDTTFLTGVIFNWGKWGCLGNFGNLGSLNFMLKLYHLMQCYNILMKELKYLVILGDVIFIAWILYNGINEGFKGVTPVQAVSYISLITLLILNIFLLYRNK